MNICFMSRVFYLGGVSTHLIDLSEELIKDGHKVSIITSGPINEESLANQKLFDSLLNLGVEYIHIDFPKRNINKFNYLLGLLRAAWNCIKVLKNRKFDIVHVHTPILSFIPKIAKIPFIRTTHLNEMQLSFLDIKADYEIAVSKEIYNSCQKKYSYNADELYLIPNGVSKRFHKTISYQDQKNIKENQGMYEKFIIGLVGSICHRKGHDILINAIALLEPELKKNIRIVFLGTGSEHEIIKIKKLLEKNNLFDQTSFLPFQNPIDTYSILDIMILPSRLEGFGLVVVEAMLMGKCVIRSNTEGSHEQIVDNVTGFIFENENYIELSKIIKNVLTDNELRLRVAKAGQEFSLKHYTSEIMTQKTLNLYENIVEEK